MHEARDHLMQDWHQKVEIERRAAELDNRPPKEVPVPTVSEITKVASEMYTFVQKKD
jgi:hypothetical protein